MKKLVVFYSFEGNTRFIAKLIAEAVGADVLELKPKEEIKTHGFMKYFLGGKQVVMNEKPELLPFDKRLEEYDMIFLGTPVWAGSYSPAHAALFSTVRFQDKKVALFCCHRGGKGKVFEKMKQQLGGNEIVGEKDFIEPLHKNSREQGEQAKQWAKKNIEKLK